jgi:hypothetical protein
LKVSEQQFLRGGPEQREAGLSSEKNWAPNSDRPRTGLSKKREDTTLTPFSKASPSDKLLPWEVRSFHSSEQKMEETATLPREHITPS